jgi:hypothetical protein
MTLVLRQTLSKPVNGYWDGGAKRVFDWRIDGSTGQYVRIGSFDANHWFHVAVGKTDKQTLSYAKKHLARSTRCPSTFEYIDN